MEHSKELPLTIYTPESQIRNPQRLFAAMWHDLLASRELAWRIFIRDVSAQYRQSILGIVWAFLSPVMTSLVFIVLQSRGVVNFGETDVPYPVFVFVGVVIWQLFTESLNAPLKAVTAAKAILVKISIPYEALILASLYSVLFNLLFKLVIIAVLFVIFNIQLTLGLLLAPFAILIVIVFGLGLGLLLTPIGVLFNDINSALPMVIQLWFFITPVIYPTPSIAPFDLIAKINPIAYLLSGARSLLVQGSYTISGPYLLACGLAILTLVIAWVIYRISLPILIERISA